MGNVALFAKNDPAGSLGLFEASVKERITAESVFGEGWAHFEVGQALLRLERPDEANTALKKARLMYDSGDESAAVLFVIMIGAVRLAQGERARLPACRSSVGAAIGAVSTSSASPKTPPRASTGRPSSSHRSGRRRLPQGLTLTTPQAVALALE